MTFTNQFNLHILNTFIFHVEYKAVFEIVVNFDMNMHKL